uniref:GK21436 n=1 Tax=Drosophila willistoni TaxID=7260 RepID=B4MQE3_DROWI
MWTYMMAAARGDRVNTFQDKQRRRPETESPKYGYNLSTRPMYRSSRFVTAASSAPAQLQLPHTSHSSHNNSSHGGHTTNVPPPPLEEISGGLFAPFTPTAEHLIANQSAISIPEGGLKLDNPQLKPNNYPRRSWLVEDDSDDDDDNDDDDVDDEDALDQHQHHHHHHHNHHQHHHHEEKPQSQQEEAIAQADQSQHSSVENYLENGRKLIHWKFCKLF